MCVRVCGAAWLQVCLLSQYKRTALHSAVQKAYCGSPHSVPATIKVLHHLSYHMLDKRCRVVSRIKRWLDTHAFWAGDAYSSWRLPDHLTVDGINGAWCWDAANLDSLLAFCTDPICGCHGGGHDNV